MRLSSPLLLGLLACGAFAFCGQEQAAAPSSAGYSFDREEDSLPAATGQIAYVRDASEIRTIGPDGRNDRRLWTHPDAKAPFGIFDLAWRPDGKELAFSSGHQNMVSLYHADLYAIRSDGSGLRRLTNRPDYDSLGRFKKGTVTITVRNTQPVYMESQASAGIFTIYVVGARMPQQVTLPPGSSRTLVFEEVADLGDHAQPVVAIYGQIRWIMPGLDVVAGRNTKAPDFGITGNGYEYFGAFRPVWKWDGSQLSYRDGNCLIKTIPARAGLGIHFQPLFAQGGSAYCYWDRGPTKRQGTQVLYWMDSTEEASGIYLRTEGGTGGPQFLFPLVEGTLDLKWLPDGSGFLYTKDYYREEDSERVSNIFHVDLASNTHRQVTNLRDGYARQFSIAPSGLHLVYEKCQIREDSDMLDFTTSDLWIIGLDGQGDRLLVKNGLAPSWSR